MAGHSKFKNIQFRKGAQDKKRSKLFSKFAREITAAAKDLVGEVPGFLPRDHVRPDLGIDEPADGYPQFLVLDGEDRMAHHRDQRCHTGAGVVDWWVPWPSPCWSAGSSM